MIVRSALALPSESVRYFRLLSLGAEEHNDQFFNIIEIIDLRRVIRERDYFANHRELLAVKQRSLRRAPTPTIR